jgi:hypothetical protein
MVDPVDEPLAQTAARLESGAKQWLVYLTAAMSPALRGLAHWDAASPHGALGSVWWWVKSQGDWAGSDPGLLARD